MIGSLLIWLALLYDTLRHRPLSANKIKDDRAWLKNVPAGLISEFPAAPAQE